MEASTPTKLSGKRRQTENLTPPDISPVGQEFTTTPDSNAPSFHSNPDQLSPTGASLILDRINMTLTRRVDTSQQIEGGANDFFNAAMQTDAFNRSFHGGRRQNQAHTAGGIGLNTLNAMMDGLDVNNWSEIRNGR